ncbi:MAG: choice-of-anchor C family protein [Gammaproteobacteria bacterium]|nr:MAG: choice-of-anchor C family protein [Gammaproteobacteria bacterium]
MADFNRLQRLMSLNRIYNQKENGVATMKKLDIVRLNVFSCFKEYRRFEAQKILAVLCTSLLFANGAHANLVVNGSFEGGTHTGGVYTGGYITLYSPSTAINGWTITAGSADWINNGVWQASDGNYSLDMSGLSAATIKSNSFSTDVGQLYELTFDMAGNFANQVLHNSHTKGMSVDVSGSSQNFSFSTPYPDWYTSNPAALMYPDMHWETRTMQFIATSTLTELVFTSFENNAYGAALDNVSVEVVVPVSSVPEPGMWMLLGSGLAGLAAFRRRNVRS